MQLQKREKRMLIALAVVAVFSAIILYRTFYSSTGPVIPTTPSQPNQTQNQGVPVSPRGSGGGGSVARPSSGAGSSGTQTVSVQEFENHVTLSSCWVLLDGEVYDISNFLATYPSFQETALAFCGTLGFEAGFIESNEGLAQTIKDQSQKIGTIS